MSAIAALTTDVVDARTAHQLATVRATATRFAVEFTDSLASQLDEGRTLSVKQRALLDRLFDEAEVAAKLPKISPDSAHLGTVGERLRGLSLTVVALKAFDGDYGVSLMHRMVDAAGNELVTFTARELAEVGQTIVVDATVKAHADWQGRKSTKLSRVKVA